MSGKIIIPLFLLFFSQPGVYRSNPATVEDCKVLLPALSGSYEGSCKKGVADGRGKASGTDAYEGEFRKGLPDGKGTCTWSNGDK
jgi:hypothetical protein